MRKEKRHAIDCKKIGESTTSPGFWKYEITIQEADGNIKKVPAYGKDMQDAISRLVWTERFGKVSGNKKITIGLIIAWISTIIGPATISSLTNKPAYILLGILFSILVGIGIIQLERYFNKR